MSDESEKFERQYQAAGREPAEPFKSTAVSVVFYNGGLILMMLGCIALGLRVVIGLACEEPGCPPAAVDLYAVCKASWLPVTLIGFAWDMWAE